MLTGIVGAVLVIGTFCAGIGAVIAWQEGVWDA